MRRRRPPTFKLPQHIFAHSARTGAASLSGGARWPNRIDLLTPGPDVGRELPSNSHFPWPTIAHPNRKIDHARSRILSRFGHQASSLRLAVMFHDIGHALVLTSRHFGEHIENSLIGAVLLRTVEKIRLSGRETQALEKPAKMRWYMPFAWHDYLHMVDPWFLTLAHAGAFDAMRVRFIWRLRTEIAMRGPNSADALAPSESPNCVPRSPNLEKCATTHTVSGR